MSVSVLVLTRNEEKDLPACLSSLLWSDDVWVLDSFSTDRTIDVARASRANVMERAFDNWAAHQNWAVTTIPFKHPWVLYVDADERVSPELAKSVLDLARGDSTYAAHRVCRRDFFADGTWLKHAQISPYFVRLFRPDKIRYERTVNPVAVVSGETGQTTGYLDHYPFSKGLDHWIARHLKYAEFEAGMIGQEPPGSLWAALFNRDFNERRQHQKRLFMRLPGRPLLKLAYMMLWRRSFLDGLAGVRYSVLQAIYEYFITLKTAEALRTREPVATLLLAADLSANVDSTQSGQTLCK